jgi:flagellar motor switch protein FliN/FliY
VNDALARQIADQIATRLGARLALELVAGEVAATAAGAAPLAGQAYPAVLVEAGPHRALVDPAGARALAALLSGEDPAEGDPSDAEFATLTAAAAELATDLADTPVVLLAADAAALGPIEPDASVLGFRLEGGELVLEVALVVAPVEAVAEAPPPEPDAAVADLEDVAADADIPHEEPASARDAPTLRAVERTAELAASAAAEVLSMLFSDDLSASALAVEEAPADPLAGLAFPLILGEVVCTAGLEGSNHFLLAPADAAVLAAAMMGTPDATGDGLSAIELSAVSEALNQLATATSQALGAALGIAVDLSPPTCIVVDDAEQARAQIGEPAYRTGVHVESAVFGAELVTLLSADLAASLGAAFATFEDSFDSPLSAGFDPFADMPFDVPAAAPGPVDESDGRRELLSGVRVRVSAELGRAKLPVGKIANLPGGSVVVLDRTPGDPVDVLVNGTRFAQAKVVLVDGEYAVQILSLTPFGERD